MTNIVCPIRNTDNPSFRFYGTAFVFDSLTLCINIQRFVASIFYLTLPYGNENHNAIAFLKQILGKHLITDAFVRSTCKSLLLYDKDQYYEQSKNVADMLQIYLYSDKIVTVPLETSSTGWSIHKYKILVNDVEFIQHLFQCSKAYYMKP